MPFPLQFIKVNNVSASTSSVPLSDGASVRVKILKDNGGGSFTAFFNGSRVEVKSSLGLKAGDSFIAQLKVGNDGQIYLYQKNAVTEGNFVKNSIEEYLLSQGIPLDGAALKIIQYMQETGLKVNGDVLKRARLLSIKFTGSEKAAGEIAAILMEKGVFADEMEIAAVLSLRNMNETGDKSSEKDKGKNLLAFMNHKKSGRKHWFVLPYTYDEKGLDAKGMIRLLVNTEDKYLEKMLVDVKLTAKTYFFVLYFKEAALRDVEFYVEPAIKKGSEGALCSLLQDFFNKDNSHVSVSYTQRAVIDGFVSSDREVFSVDERV